MDDAVRRVRGRTCAVISMNEGTKKPMTSHRRHAMGFNALSKPTELTFDNGLLGRNHRPRIAVAARFSVT